MSPDVIQKIAFQGYAGAYSEHAAQELAPGAEPIAKASFEDVFAALQSGAVDAAAIPIENTIAGRVADVHHLLPQYEAHIIAEHYEPIEHVLLGLPGTRLDMLKEVHSHVHALGQCRKFIHEHGLTPVVHADTAGSARDVAQWGDAKKAAIASRLAAERYDLEVLAENIADNAQNTTRFLLLAREAHVPPYDPEALQPVITSILFTLRSVPAALYKAIGGFATTGINLTRIESYLSGERFEVAQFFIDVEGHPDDPLMQHALDELRFFSSDVRLLGTYQAHEFRRGG